MSVVVVSGAGSGIGAAVALGAARRGSRVVALDVDAAGLRRVTAHATDAGAEEFVAIEADVRSETAVRDALAQCQARFGVATAVLANAGIEINAPAHDLALADWNKTLEVNLTGAFLTARQAIAGMLGAGLGGSVVLVSSPAAFVGFAGGGNAAYAASKGGVSAIVRSLALDYAHAGIRVNGVVPGATNTPLLVAGSAPDARDEHRARIEQLAREQVPLRRLGHPHEIAEAVLWLFSDASSYVTGSHLVVDGGLLAKSANTF